MSYDNFTHGGCKVDKPTPHVSRRDEVEAIWDHWGCTKTSTEICGLALEQARTLADEVDAKDKVISALLLAMKPGDKPKPEAYDGYDQLFRERLCRWNDSNKRYARALEIAGRKE